MVDVSEIKTEQQAVSVIQQLTKEATEVLCKAADIAKEFGVEFSWDGPAYGMGGWYSSDEWQSSSDNC